MPIWTALSFQDALSPAIEHIMFFHDHTITVMVLVTTMTVYLLVTITNNNNFDNFTIEGQEIEIIWTILPALLLVSVALPSFNTLYLIEETVSPNLTLNIKGHQWYWSYEYSTLGSTETESFLSPSNTARLLKTDTPLYLPTNTLTRALITSNDVIHSWTIPSLGVNADALPGRLNQTFLLTNRAGLYTGQCSEICGTNHSIIPILAMCTSPNEFLNNANES